ncbi:plastocyanin [Methanolinea mesophila]|uniref:hypothetical protein n=1 Tax=Methanolinea mesophila TaxID=547055 RepID=UPI001AE3E3C2|nr:hypothetical protein [Methanolinea mesophila]MBP1929002.1 plastocyanin [Methanolinea mesophila]
MTRKSVSSAVLVAGIVLILAVWCAGCTTPVPQSPAAAPAVKQVSHYMDALPYAGEVFPGPPVNVVVDTDTRMVSGSSMSVKNNGVEYGVGPATVDESGVTLRQMFSPDAPDGTYTVTYTTCLETGGCEQGTYQFSINRSLASSYTDLRGQSAVVINIVNGEKDPRYVIVSPGTTVTWTNMDTVNHTADSDTHMTHSNYPEMDSGDLTPGDTFTLVLDKPGVYPNHCSDHPETEHAIVIVQ